MNTKSFFYSFIVEEKHLDAFQHMNNATYLTLFEKARWEIINNNGYSLQKIKEMQLAPAILEIKIKFLKELRLNDSIIIETKLNYYKNKIGSLSQWMRRENETCCAAEFTIGLLNLKTRKLVLPTTEWLTAISGAEGIEK